MNRVKNWFWTIMTAIAHKRAERKAKKAAEGFYTRSKAVDILELFEDVLDRYDITVPSPEDDEREPDNTARLYGSVYWELLDEIEDELIFSINKAKKLKKVIPYEYEPLPPWVRQDSNHGEG